MYDQLHIHLMRVCIKFASGNQIKNSGSEISAVYGVQIILFCLTKAMHFYIVIFVMVIPS